MGGLDPKQVRAAVLRGLGPLDQRIAAAKSKKVAKAWEKFNQEATAKLLSGDLDVDQWRSALEQFGGFAVQSLKSADAQASITEGVNSAAIVVEEAFEPPSSMGWLIFAGVGATAFAYWWLQREEKQKEMLVATPEIIVGSRRQGKKAPTVEIEDAEFEEI